PLPFAATLRDGLESHLIVDEDLGPDVIGRGRAGANAPEYTGNSLLFALLGADSVTVSGNGSDLLGEAETRAAELRAEGKTPYVIPVGGSNAIGALGYVDCGDELLGQIEDVGLDVTALVTPSGSAGMQAGLIVGLHAAGSDIPVLGINVS